MAKSRVSTKKHNQTVRLPAEVRFPDAVKKVEVRQLGMERIIAPAESVWGSFFINRETVSDDFMSQRAAQQQRDNEIL